MVVHILIKEHFVLTGSCHHRGPHCVHRDQASAAVTGLRHHGPGPHLILSVLLSVQHFPPDNF